MPKQPPKSETPALPVWTISKFAAKLQWVGEVEAVDEREAVEKAAEQFKAPVAKLFSDATAVMKTGPATHRAARRPSRCGALRKITAAATEIEGFAASLKTGAAP